MILGGRVGRIKQADRKRLPHTRKQAQGETLRLFVGGGGGSAGGTLGFGLLRGIGGTRAFLLAVLGRLGLGALSVLRTTVVGDVPAGTLELQRRRRKQPYYRSAAAL